MTTNKGNAVVTGLIAVAVIAIIIIIIATGKKKTDMPVDAGTMTEMPAGEAPADAAGTATTIVTTPATTTELLQ